MTQNRLEQLLNERFKPDLLLLYDWSHRHGEGHAEKLMPMQKCFDLVIVAAAFKGVPLLKRHRLIYDAAGMTESSDIHSLTIQAYTPSEWRAYQESP